MHLHEKYYFFWYSSIRQLYCCDITDISIAQCLLIVGGIQEIDQNFEKS